MRDEVYRTVAGTVTNHNPTCSGYTTQVFAQNQARIQARGRADITQGDHRTATPYRAYQYTLEMSQFKSDPIAVKLYCNGKWVWKDKWQEGRPNIVVPSACTHYIASDGGAYVPERISAVARNSVLAKAQDMKLNAAQTLAEMNSTARMLSSRFVQGARALQYFRRREFAKALSTLGLLKTVKGQKLVQKTRSRINRAKGTVQRTTSTQSVNSTVRKRTSGTADLANLWLEYNYGWKPLISDIMSAHDLIMGTLAQPKLMTVSDVYQEECPAIPYYQTRYNVKSGNWICGAEASLSFSLKDESLAMLSSMGLTNPLLLAWELLPLSFVIDWFVSVGSFLQGLGAHHGLQFHSGYVTEFSRSNAPLIEDTGWPSYPFTGEPPYITVNGNAMRRIPLTDFPRPGVSFRLDLNLHQLASASALLKQRIG